MFDDDDDDDDDDYSCLDTAYVPQLDFLSLVTSSEVGVSLVSQPRMETVATPNIQYPLPRPLWRQSARWAGHEILMSILMSSYIFLKIHDALGIH